MTRRKEKCKLPPFVPLPWEVLNSDAYKSLTPSAGKALPHFLGKDGKGKKKGAEYSGTFEFSYGEAKRLGFAQRTFARVIDDLVAKGFIDMAGYGGLRGNCKSFNRFRVSDRWKNFGRPCFDKKERYPSEIK